MSTDTIDKIKQLPDDQRTFYPSPDHASKFREMPFSTADLKALVDSYGRMRVALEHYADKGQWFLRDGTPKFPSEYEDWYLGDDHGYTIAQEALEGEG